MVVASPSILKRAAVPLLLAPALGASASGVVQHDLTVGIDPDRGRLEVVDRVRLPDGWTDAGRSVEFYLNAAFAPTLAHAGATLEPIPPAAPDGVRRYRVRLAGGEPVLTVKYSGELTQAGRAYDRGHVGPEGVYLTETSAWYPQFGTAPVTFSMQVHAPAGWTAISQGKDAHAEMPGAAQSWRETRPQTGIALLAGRYSAYRHESQGLDIRVYLRRPDAALAERYLDAATRYLDLYGCLLGAYPYEKFALVENFWETGYALPSLAVLGPRVIRFPFILHSSFPHEILHNWWGNGVYVSPASGNWSEGLTAYLADHLVQERRGHGADYRRAALQKYATYVDAADDFPLTEFRGGHGDVSQAVGYNKALMFFHMLRTRLGDAEFLAGLRRFAARHRFQPAGWGDLRAAFEAAGADLGPEFEQWVERTGAPRLQVRAVTAAEERGSFTIKGEIEQRQPGAPYRLRVPVAVQLENRSQTVHRLLSSTARRSAFEIELPARPIALHVDPEFDVFRRLAPGEIPASLGDLLGAKDDVFVLPAGDTRSAYRGLAHALGGVHIVDDTRRLPAHVSVWLLGWTNAHRDVLDSALGEEALEFTDQGLRAGGDLYRRDAACVVMAAREGSDARSIGFIGCDNAGALPGLARKIPHYGKYGFLVFTGDEPVNVRKQEWTVRASPMSFVFDGQSAHVPPRLPRRTPLADAPCVSIAE